MRGALDPGLEGRRGDIRRRVEWIGAVCLVDTNIDRMIIRRRLSRGCISFNCVLVKTAIYTNLSFLARGCPGGTPSLKNVCATSCSITNIQNKSLSRFTSEELLSE